MTIWGALAGGFVGTLVLTTGLRTATELRLTRIDLPFLLGTAFSTDRIRARAVGYALHFIAGLVFASIYFAVFSAIDEASWWLGAAFGLIHALLPARRSSTSSCRWSTREWPRRSAPPARRRYSSRLGFCSSTTGPARRR